MKHGFHKHFRHFSPGLQAVISRFVRFQTKNGHQISEDYAYFLPGEADGSGGSGSEEESAAPVVQAAAPAAPSASDAAAAFGGVVEEAEDVEVRAIYFTQNG